MAQDIVQGTASQQASAAMHLERKNEWTYIRIAGTRYVVLPSGRSGRTYWVRADAAGCSCPWYAKTFTTCAHMIAVRQTIEPIIREVRGRYAEIFGVCDARGCDEDRARGERYCDRHVLADAF